MAIIHLCKWREKEEAQAVYEEKRLRVDSVCISYKKGKFFDYKAEQVQDRQTSMLWLFYGGIQLPQCSKN